MRHLAATTLHAPPVVFETTCTTIYWKLSWIKENPPKANQPITLFSKHRHLNRLVPWMDCLGIGLNAYYFRIFKAPFPMKLQPQWISQRATAKRIATKSWDFALPLGGFFAPKTLIIMLMEEILHQLIGSLSHYLQGLIHARWCRISSINSIIYISHSTVSMYCKFTYIYFLA